MGASASAAVAAEWADAERTTSRKCLSWERGLLLRMVCTRALKAGIAGENYASWRGMMPQFIALRMDFCFRGRSSGTRLMDSKPPDAYYGVLNSSHIPLVPLTEQHIMLVILLPTIPSIEETLYRAMEKDRGCEKHINNGKKARLQV